jgi:hypothetical protein
LGRCKRMYLSHELGEGGRPSYEAESSGAT